MDFSSFSLFHIGSLPITNTLLDTLLVDVIILGFTFLVIRNLKLMPGKIQLLAEYIVGGLYSFTQNIAGKNTDKIFPYFMTFFLFILISNLSGLIPGITTVGIKNGHSLTPLLRSATSDLNTTLALSLISLVATHYLSIKAVGIKDYISRYLSLNPVLLFVGVLEIVSEITKVISLSFRLFGNIFAGEVVLETVSGIFSFIFPLPFLMLEFLVAFIQALVFSMLTMAFMVILMTPHHEEAKEVVER